MPLGAEAGLVLARRLAHELHARGSPRDLERVLLRGHLDDVAVHGEEVLAVLADVEVGLAGTESCIRR
jgi:hypothetical protein